MFPNFSSLQHKFKTIIVTLHLWLKTDYGFLKKLKKTSLWFANSNFLEPQCSVWWVIEHTCLNKPFGFLIKVQSAEFLYNPTKPTTYPCFAECQSWFIFFHQWSFSINIAINYPLFTVINQLFRKQINFVAFQKLITDVNVLCQMNFLKLMRDS